MSGVRNGFNLALVLPMDMLEEIEALRQQHQEQQDGEPDDE